MTEEEAKMILGLDKMKSLSPHQITTHYVTQITTFHPDKGGSKYLTEKIIEAKNLLSKK